MELKTDWSLSIAEDRSPDSRVNDAPASPGCGAEGRGDGRRVLAVVVEPTAALACAANQALASVTAAATAGRRRGALGRRRRGGEQRARSRAEGLLLGQVVRLVAVVAGVVDQRQALVGVRLLRRDAHLGDRLHRRRAAGPRVKQVAPGPQVGGGQPGHRDDEEDARRDQAGVEHPVGAPAQPA